MARIVVTGYMVRYPYVGNAFSYLHYLIGLARLGHEIAYLEHNGWPGACYDPLTGTWGDWPHPGLRLARELVARFGLEAPVCWVDDESRAVDGMSREDLEELLRRADLVLNLGGVCWLPEFELCRRRALVDFDPFFTQVGLFGSDLLDDHDVHFTYGVNIGQQGCLVPDRGVAWIPTVPPVVPELWRSGPPPSDAPFTTIASWGAYGGVDYQGQRYGQKDEEFLRVIDLPARATRRLELAMAAPPEVVEMFRGAGWSVRDAARTSAGLDTYQAYIAGSWGEFSVAKNGYVKSRGGWFSDRTVCYLASGRPVVVQDTGFSDWLPSGRGVVPFRDAEEAAVGLASVERDPLGHRRAAEALAHSVFSYRVVLPRLVEAAVGGPVSRPVPAVTPADGPRTTRRNA